MQTIRIPARTQDESNFQILPERTAQALKGTKTSWHEFYTRECPMTKSREIRAGDMLFFGMEGNSPRYVYAAHLLEICKRAPDGYKFDCEITPEGLKLTYGQVVKCRTLLKWRKSTSDQKFQIYEVVLN